MWHSAFVLSFVKCCLLAFKEEGNPRSQLPRGALICFIFKESAAGCVQCIVSEQPVSRTLCRDDLKTSVEQRSPARAPAAPWKEAWSPQIAPQTFCCRSSSFRAEVCI